MNTNAVRHARVGLAALALAGSAALVVGCSAPGGSMANQIQPAAHIADVTTTEPTAAAVSHTSDRPVKVIRGWKLSPLGSGEATLSCPDEYGPQHNGAGFPNFGSSNSAISATPAGFTDSSVTLWVTNWTFKTQTTTLHIWCDPN